MIIIDYSRISIAGIIVSFGKAGGKIDVDLARHFILNTIRSTKSKLKAEYGTDIVVACDSNGSGYWRRQIFPYYKHQRKAQRDSSHIDWDSLFEANALVKAELKEHFPYRVLEVPGAEADDIIGSLCHEFGNTAERIVIVGDDKDFFQLQTYMNVFQYDPVRRKKMITCPAPTRYLREHIMKGDSGDGIPSILNDDDQMVTSKRASPLRQTKLQEWLSKKPEEAFDERLLRNYRRNEQLIDLSFIPRDIQDKIVAEYHAQAGKTAGNLMSYFMEKRLRNLLDHLSDF